MAGLTITVSEDVWPTVAALLAAEFGPPDGTTQAVWANGVAAQIFADRVAELMQPPPPPRPPMRRIRPSRAHA